MDHNSSGESRSSQESVDNLLQAIGDYNIEKAKSIIGYNKDLVQAKSKLQQWTPLHVAALVGNCDAANLLLSQGADVNAKDEDDWMPLHFAVAFGSSPADMSDVMSSKFNLQTVAQRIANEAEYMTYFLNHKGSLEMAELLLLHGADINAKSRRNNSPIMWAVMRGDSQMVQLLTKHKPELVHNFYLGVTPLHYAAGKGYYEIAKTLLEQKASLTARDKYGWAPLHSAAEIGHKAIVELLLDHKASINDKEGRFDLTPLHMATDKCKMEVVKCLLDHGANVNATDRNGWTPLRVAQMNINRPGAAIDGYKQIAS